MVEYGLIISLIAVACIAALLILGPKIAELFTSVSDTITPASGAGTPKVICMKNSPIRFQIGDVSSVG